MSARALGGLLLALLVSAGVAHAELFRWVDKDGNVHYSDQPPPPNARDVQQKPLAPKPGDPPIPYQLQQATRNFPVTFYISACGDGCTQARQLLAKRGIPHTEYDATNPGFQEQLKKLTGGELIVPVLTVGRSVLRGFEAGQWNAALAAAAPVPAPAQDAAEGAPAEAAPAAQDESGN
jgi:hypothetical protein